VSEQPRPLHIWTIGDGRAGIDNQVLGLAEAIAQIMPAQLQHFVAPRPNLLSLFKAKNPMANMKPPWPDIVIGCGQASLPYTTAMRKWSDASTFCVQLQAPRRPAKQFDMIIAPAHDQLEGENTFKITGSTNRICKQKLEAAKEQFSKQIKTLLNPSLAVMIGGNSKRHKLTKPAFKKLLERLTILAASKVALMISTSRRTPGFAKRGLRRKFGKNPNVWLWTGAKRDGENPYFAFLATANAVVVTSDSTNLITEAASAGKPVLLFKLEGEDGKFADLYTDLANRNLLVPFTGSIATWDTEPFDETARAAEEVLRRFHNHLKK